MTITSICVSVSNVYSSDYRSNKWESNIDEANKYDPNKYSPNKYNPNKVKILMGSLIQSLQPNRHLADHSL